MKRKISLIILGLILIPSIIFAKEAVVSNQSLAINGQEVDLRAYNIDGHNYYKLRDLAYYFSNYDFNFSLWGDARKIIVNRGQNYDSSQHKNVNPTTSKKALAKTMSLELLDGERSQTYNVNVYNIDGYNYFKLRDIGKILAFEVDYNRAKRQVLVDLKSSQTDSQSSKDRVILGNERLLTEYKDLIKGKNVGLITNQTGIDGQGIRTVERLHHHPDINLLALYSPEHGLDGKTKAGAWVESYRDQEFDLPVYSLYGKTRKPSSAMLKGIDVLLFDIQDIGSRTYTYISCMHYCMQAAKENNIDFIVLDRPNPLGDKVEGYMLKEKYRTYVGVDIMPMSHGMTIGELARYFNREIGAKLTVIQMKNYRRDMVWQETGLRFAQTSPNIPDLKSAFNYMATGSGSGTGVYQADKFAWVGKKGIDSNELAVKLNASPLLDGVEFMAHPREDSGGVSLKITDYKTYNPARVGYYILATINLMDAVNVPREEDSQIPMFEKIQGSDLMGRRLLAKTSPEQIIAEYQEDIRAFRAIRKPYLIYD